MVARRLRDQIIAHAGPIHLRHRARVDGEQINRMLYEQRQQRVELGGRIKTDARFHSERNRYRVAQCAENGVNYFRRAQQPAAGAFAINDGRGAAEIQVNRGDGIFLQQFRRADERGNVVADELGDDGFAGRILGDGIENPFFRPRIAVDAEVFCPINIRPAVARNDAHELQRRHVLHRRERQHRVGGAEQI